jgi:hypothetical protein
MAEWSQSKSAVRQQSQVLGISGSHHNSEISTRTLPVIPAIFLAMLFTLNGNLRVPFARQTSNRVATSAPLCGQFTFSSSAWSTDKCQVNSVPMLMILAPEIHRALNAQKLGLARAALNHRDDSNLIATHRAAFVAMRTNEQQRSSHTRR